MSNRQVGAGLRLFWTETTNKGDESLRTWLSYYLRSGASSTEVANQRTEILGL